MDTEEEVPGELLELSSLEWWALLLLELALYSRPMAPMGFCNVLPDGRAQMSYGMEVVDVEVVGVLWTWDGLFIFSSRLQMRCVIAKVSSCSLELLEAALVADSDAEGLLDGGDCVDLAYEGIL